MGQKTRIVPNRPILPAVGPPPGPPPPWEDKPLPPVGGGNSVVTPKKRQISRMIRLKSAGRKKIDKDMSFMLKLDQDGDGTLTKEEMVNMLQKKLNYTKKQAEEKTNELLEKLDTDHDNRINIREAQLIKEEEEFQHEAEEDARDFSNKTKRQLATQHKKLQSRLAKRKKGGKTKEKKRRRSEESKNFSLSSEEEGKSSDDD